MDGLKRVLRRLPILLGALFMLSAWTGSFVDDVSGHWHGAWRSSSEPGYFYTYEMILDMHTDQTVEGRIRWTLRKSPRAHEQEKIGLEAVEYVRGSGNRTKRSISLVGYMKNDPNTIIGLDRYELTLQRRSDRIAGVTFAHGTWKGRFVGEKKAQLD
jgi:hypothetical protein